MRLKQQIKFVIDTSAYNVMDINLIGYIPNNYFDRLINVSTGFYNYKVYSYLSLDGDVCFHSKYRAPFICHYKYANYGLKDVVYDSLKPQNNRDLDYFTLKVLSDHSKEICNWLEHES